MPIRPLWCCNEIRRNAMSAVDSVLGPGNATRYQLSLLVFKLLNKQSDTHKLIDHSRCPLDGCWFRLKRFSVTFGIRRPRSAGCCTVSYISAGLGLALNNSRGGEPPSRTILRCNPPPPRSVLNLVRFMQSQRHCSIKLSCTPCFGAHRLGRAVLLFLKVHMVLVNATSRARSNPPML